MIQKLCIDNILYINEINENKRLENDILGVFGNQLEVIGVSYYSSLHVLTQNKTIVFTTIYNL